MPTQEFINSLQLDINKILDSDDIDPKKAMQLFSLHSTYEMYTVPVFLQQYSLKFTEHSSNKLAPKEICRILTILPLNVQDFLTIMKKDPALLKAVQESFITFKNTFPLTAEKSLSMFYLPLLTATLFYSTPKDFQDIFNLAPEFFSLEKKFVSNCLDLAIDLNLQPSIETLYTQFPQMFDLNTVNKLIKNQYPNIDFIEQVVINHMGASFHEPIHTTTVDGNIFQSTLVNCLALSALTKNTTYSWKIFDHFNHDKKFTFNTYFNQTTQPKNNTTQGSMSKQKHLMDILEDTDFPYIKKALFKLFETVNNYKTLDENELMYVLKHYIKHDLSSFVNICTTPFFKNILETPSIHSSLFNKAELMKDLFNLETSFNYEEYLKKNSIYIRPAIAIFNDLAIKFPETFNSLNLHDNYFPINKSNSTSIQYSTIASYSNDIQHIIKKSLASHLNDLKIIEPNLENFQQQTLDNFVALGLLTKNIVSQKNGSGFFSKEVKVEQLIWNEDNISNFKSKYLSSSKSNNFNALSYILGEDEKPLDLLLIEKINDESMKNIAKNLILLVHQFKEAKIVASNIIKTESEYFITNRVGAMLHRILVDYEEFKRYSPDDANMNLKLQLMMLHKKTSFCIDECISDEQSRIATNTKVTAKLITKKLAASN